MPGLFGSSTYTGPSYDGIDMSGYTPPLRDTMDVRNYYINGKEYASGSHSANALKDYLDATGQSSHFSWATPTQAVETQSLIQEMPTTVQTPPAYTAISADTYANYAPAPVRTAPNTNNLFNFQTSSDLLNGGVQPYRYGDFGLTSSDYSIWGSKGNPYYVAGPTYTPGTGAPIIPQPIGDSPVGSGDGDSDAFPGTSEEPWYGMPLYGELGLLAGRIDVPFTDEYVRLPWYEGSVGGGYGYTEEGYDKYAPGDVDRGIYDAATGERDWGEEFDDYNKGDAWAYTGLLDGIQNLLETGDWEGYIDPTMEGDPNWKPPGDLWGDAASALAKEAEEAEARIAAEKEAAAQAEIDKLAEFTGMLQSEFDAQMAAQEDLNAEQISLMYEIKDDMQRDFGDFTTDTSKQMAQIAAENAAMFDSIEEYREWQLDTEAHQQAWMENQFKDQAAAQQQLSEEQKGFMDEIAMDMQRQYGEFTGETGKQLAEMAAQNASLFNSFAEYKQWMGEEFTTLESGLNEQLAQQAAVNEGLNASQIGLMNDIAQEMRNTYGEFAGGVEGQLEQMAAENAAMFDTLDEYKQWMAEEAAAEEAARVEAAKQAEEARKRFEESQNSDHYDPGYSDSGTASDSDMAEAGFSQEDQDFIDSGFDDDSSSDSGGGGDFHGGDHNWN